MATHVPASPRPLKSWLRANYKGHCPGVNANGRHPQAALIHANRTIASTCQNPQPEHSKAMNVAETESFRCFIVRKQAGGSFASAIERCSVADLPDGEVLIRVKFSSLNYKDALSATGHPGVSKNFPHVPGIDAAGTVVDSRVPKFQPGQAVIVTGFGFGASRWGGYADYARVPADWIVPLPAGLTLRESMIYGTAGFTAGMSLEVLVRHGIEPAAGPVLVTGASGGVGTLAVGLLAKAGFQVHAVTGKPSAHELLRRLGATGFLTREEADDRSDNPLLKAQWAAVVDTVGGNILSTALRSTRPGGCVTACGLTAGIELPITVYPFILRGVSLAGIESGFYPLPKREALWKKLADDWKLPNLELLANTISLEELPDRMQAILAGQITGRVVVQL
jgi:acrylyl-CoA reductase (NADPH)